MNKISVYRFPKDEEERTMQKMKSKYQSEYYNQYCYLSTILAFDAIEVHGKMHPKNPLSVRPVLLNSQYQDPLPLKRNLQN